MVKDKAKKHIIKLSQILTDNLYSVGPITEKNFNFECDVFLHDKKFKLLVYFGKKGIKTVLQGNSNLPEYSKLKELITGEPDIFKKEILEEEAEKYIGTDETGKGDLFGPLVVAGVYVNKNIKESLYNIGVKDSKELSDNSIWQLAIKIAEIPGIIFKVKSIEPEEYNLMYEQHKNINSLLDKLHSDIVEEILAEVDCKTVITDKFHTKDIHIQAANKYQDIKFIAVNKAEKFVAVAAASILARAKMIQWFQRNKIMEEYFPLGSSNDAESFIINKKDELQKSDLNKYAKLHFRTWKKLGIEYNS